MSEQDQQFQDDQQYQPSPPMQPPPPPKRKRSFRVIIKILKIILALIIVFWASFFITLALNSSDPVEKISSYFSEPEKTDVTFDLENKPAEKKSESVYNPELSGAYGNAQEKEDHLKKNPAVDFSDKAARIFDVENAVNAKIKIVSHYTLLKDVPRAMRQAVIAVEDTRFYSHSGFDISGIARATVNNVESGEIQEGASTITQQLAKNLFLTPEKTFSRKIEEVLLAVSIERNFQKDKILEMYLNTIYFGSGFYGIYDAAQGYFDKEPKDLTVAESAMLAGIPNAPSVYSPYVNFSLAKKRQLVVIDAMIRAHFLSEREAENARVEEIILRPVYQ